MLAAGVCHSDLHLSDGYFDLGGGKRLSLADRGMKLPVTLGHENVGEVVALGPAGAGRQDRRPAAGRSLDRLRRLRGLPARRRTALPQAAQPRRVPPRRLRDHLMVPHPRYLFDIGDLPPERAAPLACSGVTTYGALKKVGPTLDDRADRHHRRRRARPDVPRAAQGDGRPQRHRGRHRSGQARRRRRRPARSAVIDGGAPDAAQQIIAATNGGAWAVIDLVGSSAHRAARHRQPDQGRQATSSSASTAATSRCRCRRSRCARSRCRAPTSAA